jgi:LysM repeat protein
MRALGLTLLATSAGMLVAPVADAHRLHTVGLGETPWWIAAQNDLTTRTVADHNDLAPAADVVLGSTIKLPTPVEGALALAAAGPTSVTPAPPPSIAASRVVATGAPPALGAYVVRAGDTLSALAAPTPVSAERLAFLNGLDPDAILAIGTVLRLPEDAPAPAPAPEPEPITRIVAAADPLPAEGTLSAQRVMQLAAEQGAPASLAAAIAWRESGFDNAAVSSANARGIMQVLPGTWDWVRANLATAPLSPASAEDNVRAGSLYLARLLRDTGGDVRLATAAYYQGLWSVRNRGMFDDTRRYVDDVLALRASFGGV